MVLNKARLSLSRFCGRGQDTRERRRPRQPRVPKQRCPHVVLALVEDLVVLADRRQEYDGGDVVKTVDPLPPLGALAAHVHHPEDNTVPAVSRAFSHRDLSRIRCSADYT